MQGTGENEKQNKKNISTKNTKVHIVNTKENATNSKRNIP